MPTFDPENPPLTDEELARMKPFPGDMPAGLAAAIQRNYDAAQARRRGKQRTPTKAVVTIRLESTTLAAWRATGKGWQTRLSAAIAGLPVRRPRTAPRRPAPRRSAKGARSR